MQGHQNLTLSLLIVLGIVLLMISAWGNWFQSVVDEIVTHHDVKMDFSPFANDQPSRINPDTGRTEIQSSNGDWLEVPGAGGNPQIAPGVG